MRKPLYITFPRVGNTMMRKYLENVTGITTGSEMTPALSVSIMYIGLKGESITDNTVWIAKSHAPLYSTGGANIVQTNQMFCCVRNILDVICSFFNFKHSFTQDLPVEN